VHPKVSIDLVLDLFKKLGMRKIIVRHMGKIQGIITKKDVLVRIGVEGEGGSKEGLLRGSFDTDSVDILVLRE
jgi:hypothetical protein